MGAGQCMASRQDLDLQILMGEGIGCMTDEGDGVVVWEGAWEEERREREGKEGFAWGGEGKDFIF